MVLEKLSNNLEELRGQVIGIAFVGGRMELVVSKVNNYLKTVTITKWGALQTTHIDKEMVSRYIELPNNWTLLDAVNNPFEFADFCKKHNL